MINAKEQRKATEWERLEIASKKIKNNEIKYLGEKGIAFYILLFYNPREGLQRDRDDTKGTFHAKMGTINDRNGMDLTEAEDIKKRWKEYTEELY